MVGRAGRRHKSARFAEPLWNEHSPEWQRLDQQLPQNHLARCVAQAVQRLDLSALWESYDARGSDAVRPDLMLTIVLIEIRRGRHCPSQWRRDTKENITLQWAGRGLSPSRSSWYNFRDRIARFLDDWIRQVATLAQENGLTRGERAALDGTFVAANASRHRLVHQEQLAKRLERLEQALSQESTSPQAASPASSRQETAGQARLPAWMAKTPATRQAQYQRHQVAAQRLQELHAVNDRQSPSRRRAPKQVVVSLSDPHAALGRDKLKVFRPLYNVQFMRDLDSPLILGYDALAQNHDAGTLQPMLERVAWLWGSKPRQVLTDATYVTGANLAYCQQAQVELCGPYPEHEAPAGASSKACQQIPKDQFVWLPDEQAYRCPEGHLLRGAGRESRLQADGSQCLMYRFQCAPAVCRACPRAGECVTNPNRGRTIKRSEHEDLIKAHRARMATDEAKALYRLRQQTVELGFADMKEHRGLRRLSGRGPTRARAEAGLVVLSNNLLYVHQTLAGTASNHCAAAA